MHRDFLIILYIGRDVASGRECLKKYWLLDVTACSLAVTLFFAENGKCVGFVICGFMYEGVSRKFRTGAAIYTAVVVV
jgi:hypothetical protein